MFRVIAFSLLLSSCSSTKVTSGDWVKCWEICGKGDKVRAVDKNQCICRGGMTHEFKVPTPSESVFDMVGAGQP